MPGIEGRHCTSLNSLIPDVNGAHQVGTMNVGSWPVKTDPESGHPMILDNTMRMPLTPRARRRPSTWGFGEHQAWTAYLQLFRLHDWFTTHELPEHKSTIVIHDVDVLSPEPREKFALIL